MRRCYTFSALLMGCGVVVAAGLLSAHASTSENGTHYTDVDRRLCIILQDKQKRDVPFCLSESWGAGGAHAQMIGPLEINPTTGQYHFAEWATASADGPQGVTKIIHCDSDAQQYQQPSLDNLMPAEFDRPQYQDERVRAKFSYPYVPTAMHTMACTRLQHRTFTEDEQQRRVLFKLQEREVELRPDEYERRDVWLYFNWPSPTPHMEKHP